MRDFEIESKLKDKVDKWEFHSLQTENQRLKNEISELNRLVGELKSSDDNKYYLLERLLNLLAENTSLSECSKYMNSKTTFNG